LLALRRPPSPSLFPYTTLFRSDGTFRAFWAHSLAEERAALREFLDYLAERRTRFPGMHVYHYASYERTHLLSIAARHGMCEEEVDRKSTRLNSSHVKISYAVFC